MVPDNEDDRFDLSPEQEESVQMIRQAVIESSETGVSEEILFFMLLQIAAELSVVDGYSKANFLKCASALYDDCLEDILVEQASEIEPIDE